MKLLTKHFGEIEVDQSKVITFREGIPGFRDCRRFLLLKEEREDGLEDDTLFWWLQSIDDGDIAFVLMDVFQVMPEYNPLINCEDIEDLGEYKEEDFLVYNVAVIPDDVKKLTVNLQAPIVINSVERKGKQVIVTNEEYGIRYPIFEEMKDKG